MSARRIAICHEGELAQGEVRQFELRPGPAGMPRRGLLIRDLEGQLRAYVNICMHLPVPLCIREAGLFNKEKTRLMCRTHGALYRLDDGYCTEGPCQGMSLESLELEVDEHGQVAAVEPDDA